MADGGAGSGVAAEQVSAGQRRAEHSSVGDAGWGWPASLGAACGRSRRRRQMASKGIPAGAEGLLQQVMGSRWVGVWRA